MEARGWASLGGRRRQASRHHYLNIMWQRLKETEPQTVERLKFGRLLWIVAVTSIRCLSLCFSISKWTVNLLSANGNEVTWITRPLYWFLVLLIPLLSSLRRVPIDSHFPDQLVAIVEVVVDPSGIEFRSGLRTLARLPVFPQQCQSSGSDELLRLPEVSQGIAIACQGSRNQLGFRLIPV